MTTRRGRCGEWANAFAAVAAAAGLPTRFVVDASDHVWCEVWDEDGATWLHCDPCEAMADEPLVYEGGWGKAPAWVFAFGDGAAVDVTRRYTVVDDGVLAERRAGVEVGAVREALAAASARLAAAVPAERRAAAAARAAADAAALGGATPVPAAAPLPGRTAGGAAWIKARGEDGKGAAQKEEAEAPAPPPPADDFAAQLRAAFDALRLDGVPPNDAAVEALKRVHGKA
jgi:peptide-N4-(N-acetyl-beta-glucosaminyl)asparagine amidase